MNYHSKHGTQQFQSICLRGFLARLLCVSLCARRVEAVIELKTGNYSIGELPDLPAAFGPNVPEEGVQGVLVVADPLDACGRLKAPKLGTPWIALIVRSRKEYPTCTFDTKVLNAQLAGAVAAIVYDDADEPLIIMSKPLGGAPVSIPSVFVSQKTGIIMQRLMTPGSTLAIIQPLMEGVWVSIFLSACSGAIAIVLMLLVFSFVRIYRLRNSMPGMGYSLLHGVTVGMTPADLRALPVVIHEASPHHHPRHPQQLGSTDGGTATDRSSSSSSSSGGDSPKGRRGGGTLKTCAVCLEDYRDGEKLRVLPCKHRYHMECIDQWLSSRRPLCPVCKWDAMQPLPVDVEAAAEAAGQQGGLFSAGYFSGRWRRWRWGRRHPQQELPEAVGAEVVQAFAGEPPPLSSSNRSLVLSRSSASLDIREGRAAAAAEAGQSDLSGHHTMQNFPGMHFDPVTTSSMRWDRSAVDSEIRAASGEDEN